MITEGIVWEKKDDEWIKVLDNWPAGRRGARLVVDDEPPFGQYSKAAAIAFIEESITKGPLRPERYRLAMIPGKEMTEESKEKLKELGIKKKIERGEIELPESYVSAE
jgi:hypothetical protein